MREILIATNNSGKLRDFAAAAAEFRVQVAAVPRIDQLPAAREDAPTFEANACKKAEHYSRFVKGEYVLGDDSGLVVDALGGAPGVRSARYAADAAGQPGNSPDQANNARLLDAMKDVPDPQRSARFVCCIAVARDGRTVVCFRAEVQGHVLHQTRGSGGFGYDPLFYLDAIGKSMAELAPEEKPRISHRGQAFRKFLNWYSAQPQATQAVPNAATQS